MENISKNSAFFTTCLVYNEWPTGFLHFCWQRSSWQLWNWTLRLVTFPPKKSWGKKSKFSHFSKVGNRNAKLFTPNPGKTSNLRIRLALAFGISRIRWAYRETTSLVRLASSFQQGFWFQINGWWMDGNVETKFSLWMLCSLEAFFKLKQCMLKKNMDVGWMFGETKQVYNG